MVCAVDVILRFATRGTDVKTGGEKFAFIGYLAFVVYVDIYTLRLQLSRKFGVCFLYPAILRFRRTTTTAIAEPLSSVSLHHCTTPPRRLTSLPSCHIAVYFKNIIYFIHHTVVK